MPPDHLEYWNGTPVEKRLLLEVARRAIVAGVQGLAFEVSISEEARLREPWGAFVTLRRRGRLRGCMGQLPSGTPLIEVVPHCAKSAALEDPRFAPLRSEEISKVVIEISVLSALEKITLQKIEIGRHGLCISRGNKRGVLLPQVATEFRWSAERFLEEACIKAGIGRQGWQDPDTEIQAFSAEVFSEEAPAAEK